MNITKLLGYKTLPRLGTTKKVVASLTGVGMAVELLLISN